MTGQKVWTSGAQYSKWCMLVARTDSEVAKHKGLTYFLMDMDQDAVQVRPLRQITGEAEFNELFIEEARIPDWLQGCSPAHVADHPAPLPCVAPRTPRPSGHPAGLSAPARDRLVALCLGPAARWPCLD